MEDLSRDSIDCLDNTKERKAGRVYFIAYHGALGALASEIKWGEQYFLSNSGTGALGFRVLGDTDWQFLDDCAALSARCHTWYVLLFQGLFGAGSCPIPCRSSQSKKRVRGFVRSSKPGNRVHVTGDICILGRAHSKPQRRRTRLLWHGTNRFVRSAEYAASA